MQIRAALLLPLLGSFALSPLEAKANDRYSDGKLTVDWAQTDQGFSGTITLGTQQFPATARAGADGLSGSFVSGTNQFPFTGSLNGDTLTLTTGNTTYQLKKQTAAVNPLATPGAAAAPNPTAAAVTYTLVASTDAGKAISIQKDGVTSIQAALESTLPDLAHYFGAKPVVGSAYQDAKDSKSGGATFSVVSNGQPIKGIISTKLNDRGAGVAVVFARADASKADWDKLVAPPAPSDPSASAQATPAFALQEFDFPDGTGSLQLASGWTTNAQTCVNPVVIIGPAKQAIVLNNTLQVETPDSPLQRIKAQNQRMMQQMAANARAQGRPALPPMPQSPPSLVSAYCEPVKAIGVLLPQMSAISQFNHGPATRLDKIISSKDAPCAIQGGKGAVIKYAYTQTTGTESTQFVRSVYLQTYPMGQTMWAWRITGVAAPAATFEQDAPVMFAMMNSLKINQARWTQVLNAQTQQNMQNIAAMGQAENQVLASNAKAFQEQQDSRNAVYQQQHDAQMEGYHEHNAQWAADETQKQRNVADFIETIQGTRTVYDTQTGASGQANLSDVTGVVNSLNAAALDPNRFVQVPLRDYLYAPTPVPTR